MIRDKENYTVCDFTERKNVFEFYFAEEHTANQVTRKFGKQKTITNFFY